METQQFVEKINKNINLSSGDLEDLVNNVEIERIFLDAPNRWDIPVLSIVKIAEKFYSIRWRMGSAECQEDFVENQVPQEVQHVIHQKVIKEWIAV